MFDIMVFGSRLIFILCLIAIFIVAVLCCIKAKQTAKKRYISSGLILFLLFVILFRFGFFGTKTYNANIEIEKIPKFFSEVTELLGNVERFGTFETDVVVGSFQYYEAEENGYNDIASIVGEDAKIENVDGLQYGISPIRCSHREFYVLGLPQNGSGKVAVVDDNHILVLYYMYKSTSTDFLFPMIAQEFFYCRDIDLDNVYKALKDQSGDG